MKAPPLPAVPGEGDERRDAEQRFRQFFEHASDAAFVHDADGWIVDVNAAACASLGYHREELLQLGVPDIEAMHTGEGFLFWRELPVGSTEKFEGLHRRKDGTTFPVEVHVSVLETDEGRQLLALARDISERKRSEGTLRAVEARYLRIAANTSGMVFHLVMKLDRSVALTFVSEGCRPLYELEPAEMLAEPRWLHWVVHPDDKENYRQTLHRSVETLEPYHWEGRVRLRSGTVRWVTARAHLDPQPNGDVLWNGVVLDVSELELARQAMVAAKEEAERANNAKSEFLSRMSHELRTPLNAILGFGQLLELSPLKESDAKGVGYILKAGRHLVSLVDEVLDLARVEAGELGLNLTALTFDKFAQECAGLVARSAQARGITCTVSVCPACQVPVRADEQRLRQVLLNLLSNAIKYNRENGQIALRCERMPSGYVRLEVSDTGPGIPPEGLPRLFAPFDRLGQETGEVEGTGLGLVVSKSLVEAMGGHLGVASEVGRGSTFWVELPVAVISAATELPDNGTIMPSAAVPQEPAAATLLYIEDNASNVQVVEMIVERMRPHWRLLSAQDGQSGLRLAREQHPDLVLLDLQILGMGGDMVLVELRANPTTCRIPVLMLSADATSKSRERLLALGADGYLPKPFDIAALLEKIDALLDAGRSFRPR